MEGEGMSRKMWLDSTSCHAASIADWRPTRPRRARTRARGAIRAELTAVMRRCTSPAECRLKEEVENTLSCPFIVSVEQRRGCQMDKL